MRAIVVSHTDKQRMGKIKVWCPDLGTIEDRDEAIHVAQFLTPFASTTAINRNKPDGRNYEDSSQSYGMWYPAPEVGSEVVVIFLNGQTSNCFYIGGIYNLYQNHSVGTPAASDTTYVDGEEKDEPTLATEGNRLRLSPGGNEYVPEKPRAPAHYLQGRLGAQGLNEDPIRGYSYGARHASYRRMFGISTSRGNHFTIDEGYTEDEVNSETTEELLQLPDPAKDTQRGGRRGEFIRLRTRSGAQIMINEEHGMVYLVSRDGNNWVEMANDGHIDVYAADDVSIHSEQSINLVAGKDINIEAKRGINMKAVDKNIMMQAKEDIHQYAEQNIKVSAEANFDLLAGETIKESAGGDFHVSASGQYAEDAEKIWMNSGKSESAESADVPEIYELSPESESGETATGNKSVTKSIADRVPEHEPWGGHKSQAAHASRPPRPDPESGGSSGGSGGSGSSVRPVTGSPTAAPYVSGQTSGDATVKGATERVLAGEEDTTSPKFEASEMQLSEDGALHIMNHERYRATKYWDHKGYSIGYGHLITPQEEAQGYLVIDGERHPLSKPLPEDKAYSLFLQDSPKYQNAVRGQFSGSEMTQAQYDASTSLAYNVGTHGIGSNYTKYLKQGDLDSATYQFIQHSNASGKRHPGLVRRREAEAQMIRNGKYPQGMSREELRAEGLRHLQKNDPAAYQQMMNQ